MSTIFNSTILWTSPLLNYQPLGQWLNGRTLANSNVSLNFWGTGIQLFGHANSQAYNINLDGVTRPVAQRHYVQSEVPVDDPACQNPTSDTCVVLFEFFGLNPNEMHTLVLNSLLSNQAQRSKIDILSATILFDAGISINNNTVTTLQANDTSLSYTGSWTPQPGSTQSYMISSTTGDSVSFTFTGYALSVSGSNKFGESSYEITLDGAKLEFSASGSSQNQADDNLILWARSGLEQGKNHTVTMTNKDSRNLTISAFKITNIPEGTASFATTSAGPPSWLSYTTSDSPSSLTTGIATAGSPPAPSKLSPGVIGGISVGSAALLALILIVVLLICRRRTRKRKLLESHAFKSSDHSNASELPLVSHHPSITPYRVPTTISTTTTPSTRRSSVEKGASSRNAAPLPTSSQSKRRSNAAGANTQPDAAASARDAKRRPPATQTDNGNAGASSSNDRRREKSGLHPSSNRPVATAASTPQTPPISRDEKAQIHERAMSQARNAQPMTFTGIVLPDDRRTAS